LEGESPAGFRGFIARFEWRLWRHIFIIFLLITIITIVVGALQPLSDTEATDIQKNFDQILNQTPDALFILRNNFGIASLMLIPVLGPVVGVFVLHNTGLAISAVSYSADLPGILVFLGLLLLPFSWLEFISYSAAMTQSVFLMLALFQRRGVRKELTRTGLIWAAIFAMLIAGAIIEMLFVV
jgi:hypothetical protein